MQPQAVIPFGGVPQPPEDAARAAIIPAPLEATVSYGHGAALGPASIMAASLNMELFDEVLGYEPISRGILTRAAVNVRPPVAEVLGRIAGAVGRELDAGRLPVVLGGEHTVTLGALQALVERRGPDFTVLCLDAHLDMRAEYEGDPLSHACVMRRAMDMGLAARWVGSRSCSAAEAAYCRQQGLEPAWAHQVHADPRWLERCLAGLEGPVYITLDVDGLDASVMPATGTPEPGGLSWTQADAWLRAVCAGRQVLGLDIVELAPLAGQPAWDFTAARLLYRALGYILKDMA